ncbi:MAG: hypothetical protein H7Y15_12815 [Pseudonocardia sp.]|nr:hypothetical protein [Pseudonocardia sp.]
MAAPGGHGGTGVAHVNAVAEKLALAPNEAGMQRMVVRVTAAFLFCNADSLTAGDLQGALDASAGSSCGRWRTCTTTWRWSFLR